MKRTIALALTLALATSASMAQVKEEIPVKNRTVKIYHVKPEIITKWDPRVSKSNLDSCIAHSDSAIYAGSCVYAFRNKQERNQFFSTVMSPEKDGFMMVGTANPLVRFGGSADEPANCISVGYIDNLGSAPVKLPDNGEIYMCNPEDDAVNVDCEHIYYPKITNDLMNDIPVLIVKTLYSGPEALKEEKMKTTEAKPSFRSPGFKPFKKCVPIDSTETDGNLRIAVWPYVIEYETGEIYKYMAPRVLNGAEFEELQKRNLAYNIRKRDKFRKYTIDNRVMHTLVSDSINFNDSITGIKDTCHYIVRGFVYKMNTDKILEEKDIELDDGRDKEPLRFIKVELKNAAMSYKRYEKYGKVEAKDDSKETNLFFKQGAATLSSDDYEGLKALQECLSFVKTITSDPDYSSIEFSVTGYASPEGDYNANSRLALNRAQYLLHQLQTKGGSASYKVKESIVQPWTVVADTLARMGFELEAQEVREICDRYKTMPEQYSRISALGYYRNLINDVVLPKLRIDKIAAKWVVNRVLPRHEIVAKYYADKESYLKGRGHMAYEYYELMQHFQDSIDVVGPLAKVAYEKYPDVKDFSDGFAVNENNPDRPWSIAAYHYARYLKSQGIYNDTLLMPYLKVGGIPNFPAQWDPNVTPRNRYVGSPYFNAATYNDEAIALLQIDILFSKRQYRKADSIYVGCVNTTKYPTIGYFLKCFMNPAEVSTPEIREGIAITSDWNRYMIYAAQEKGTPGWANFNNQAVKLYNEGKMPKDDPRVVYTLSIIKNRLGATSADQNSYRKYFDETVAAYEANRPAMQRDLGTDYMWQALMLDESILDRWLKWDGYFHKKFYEAARETLNKWHLKQAKKKQQEEARKRKAAEAAYEESAEEAEATEPAMETSEPVEEGND